MYMGTTMEKLFLTTLIFTLCATKWLTSTAYVLHRVDESIDEDAASISTVNSEVFSRLDYTPCNHANVPALNRQRILFTRLEFENGLLKCDAYRSFLRTFPGGDTNVKFISSPHPPHSQNYVNNRLVFYNLGCAEGYNMQLIFTQLQLQGKIHISQGSLEEYLCVDYVNVTAPGLAPILLCGNGNEHPVIHIPGNRALVLFRTSAQQTAPGFRISAICQPIVNTAMTQSCMKEQAFASVKDNTIKLLNLYKTHLTSAHLLSDWHYHKMVKLASACANSCNSLARVVGEEVLKALQPPNQDQEDWKDFRY